MMGRDQITCPDCHGRRESGGVACRLCMSHGTIDDRRAEPDRRSALPSPMHSAPDGWVLDITRALREAIDLIRKHVPEDALGFNSMGDADVPGGMMSWPIRDEYLHYMERALAAAPLPADTGGKK